MAYPLKPDQKDNWEYKLVGGLTKGLNIDSSADRIDDEECLQAKNVVITRSRMKVDTGYKQFGSEVAGIPQATYQFVKSNGASELLLITTETIYNFSLAKDQWQFLPGAKKSNLSNDIAAGTTTIPVANSTGFTVGRRVGITLADSTQLQTTIATVPDVGNITIPAPGIPAGKSANSGASVVEAVLLQGSIEEPVSAETLPSHDWFVFSNGVNVVKRYNSIDCVDLPGLPTNTIAKWVRLYNNCLFLINTIEGGAAHPRRVRRSDSGVPTQWTPGTGIAGFDDLLDAEDPLQCAEILGPYLVVYAEREIYRGEFIGTGGINYKFDPMIRGEGAMSPYAVADIGDFHLLVAQSNIYAYRAGFELEPIGDNIYYRLFGSQGLLSPANKHKTFSFYMEELDEVWIFWPSTSAVAGCDRLLRYNVGQKTFTERKFPNEFIGFGFFETRSSRTWASLVGSWRQQTWKWNERTLLSTSPTTHLCLADAGKVMEYDYIQTLDNGSVIPYIVESKDFLAPDLTHRFDMLEMGIRGNNVLVQASIDEGASWLVLGTISNATMQRARVNRQFTFNKVRFRWSGEGNNFELNWFGFSHKKETV